MTRLLAFDDRSSRLYFQATKPDQPQSRHIYELKLSLNRGSSDYLKCITCDLHLINRNSRGDQNSSADRTSGARNPKNRLAHSRSQFDTNSTDYFILDSLLEDLNLSQHQPINFTVQNFEINEDIISLRRWITNCDNYDASFSPDFRYFALVCNGPNVPYVELWQNDPVKRMGKSLFQAWQSILTSFRIHAYSG